MWEREYHHLNLDEGVYEIGLVEQNVQDRHGKPSRHILQIHMGAGEFEAHVGHKSVRVKLGGDFTVKADGSLEDREGNAFDPREFEREIIRQLNGHHAVLRAFARRHSVPEMKTGKANANGIIRRPAGKEGAHDGAARPQGSAPTVPGAEPARQDKLPGS